MKTYQNVIPDNRFISFRISRMEEIYDQRNGKKDEAHRHDYFTAILVQKASGKHMIDFREYDFSSHQVFFLNPGQVHQVVEYEKPQGYVLLFSAQFLVENNIPGFLIEDLNLFNEEGNSPPLALTGEEYLKLSGFCEEMIRLYNSGLKFKEQAISAFLQLFLIHANSFCTLVMANPQNQEAGNSILRDFKKLIRENYSKWHLTSEYAKLLYVTPDHLNRVVNSLTGKTAKDLIKAQIIIAAKRMIYFSGLTTKEIAYQLGFSSPANFSAFFRNYTGYSPSEFNKLR